MPMPDVDLLDRHKLSPLELDAERFAYAVWKRFEDIQDARSPGWKDRILANDFKAVLDASYDEYYERNKKKVRA